jgi:ABC-type nitrate/sulfonate/bicarbonate transport system permease component
MRPRISAFLGRTGRRVLLPLLVLAALIGLWQALVSSGALHIERILVASPAEVASSIWENRSLLAENAWVTLQEIVLGFLVGLLAGLVFAVPLRLSETLRRAVYPLAVGGQAVPIMVIAPLLVVWFGYGIVPKLGIVALICFFPVAVNAADGLRSVDPEATKMMRTLDASRLQILWRVEAPTSLPFVFSGVRIAAALAPIGAVFGEWAGAQSGLGHLILEDNGNLETARIFASTVLLAVFGVALFGLVALAERRVVTWR